MRAAALVCLLVLTTGCLGPDDGGTPGSANTAGAAGECPRDVVLPEGDGPRTEVQLANEMDQATCVTIWFDETVVAAVERPAEHPALHANPSSAAAFPWATDDVAVRVVDEATGRDFTTQVDLQEGRYVVIRVDEAEITVATYPTEPIWE